MHSFALPAFITFILWPDLEDCATSYRYKRDEGWKVVELQNADFMYGLQIDKLQAFFYKVWSLTLDFLVRMNITKVCIHTYIIIHATLF